MSLMKDMISSRAEVMGGYQETLHLENDGTIHLHTHQSTAAEVKLKQQCEDFRNTSDGYDQDRSMRHVGRIGFAQIAQLRKIGIDVFSPEGGEELAHMLDTEWTALKTATGTIASRPQRKHFSLSRGNTAKKPRKKKHGMIEVVRG